MTWLGLEWALPMVLFLLAIMTMLILVLAQFYTAGGVRKAHD